MSDRILVVDDEQNIRRSFEIILGGAGFDVESAESGEDALAQLQRGVPRLMFLDINLPGIDGMEVLRQVRTLYPELAVVMISGHATIERAIEATRLGAFDFVEKPFSRDRIHLLARNATEAGRLKEEVARLRAKGGQDEMLGESPGIQSLREATDQVAPTDTRVLILGESGSGKELVASRLHRKSKRAQKPYVRVNCAAIPDDLIEAELFGVVKGAYTGATANRKGRFAAADGGTIFLDEIGDMSIRTQAKVLRVLQEGEFESLGSTKTSKVNVRVLAATHQDLKRLVKEGLFREDLLFRLNVIPLNVPPLRERTGDVELLALHFLANYTARHEQAPCTLTAAAIKLLEAYSWPGNIRELKNLIERLVILCAGREIGPKDLPLELRQETAAGASGGGEDGDNPYGHLPLREAKDRLERDMIDDALTRHKGNVTRAASDLGLERTHLHKRIKVLGLRAD
ncbi:MAG: sigma-54-dependent Fis family transcriptional regulator [bacterium]|nr:sigma-54-dependent Fis family transcriptional regulator [bacterium]